MDQYSTPRRVWRAINPTLLYMLITLGVTIIVMVVYLVAAPTPDSALDNIMNSVLLLTLIGNIGVLAAFIPMWRKSQRIYPRWNGVRFSPTIALCSAGIALGFNMLLSIIINATGISERFEAHDLIDFTITSASLPLQVLAVCIIGPVAEELCFRGVTLSRMSRIRPWIAVLIQAVLFGIVHLNVLQSSYAALLGIFLGYITVRYRNIMYAIIGHIAFNAYTVVLGAIKSDSVISAIGIVIIFLTVLSVIGLVKSKKPEPYIEPPSPEAPELIEADLQSEPEA